MLVIVCRFDHGFRNHAESVLGGTETADFIARSHGKNLKPVLALACRGHHWCAWMKAPDQYLRPSAEACDIDIRATIERESCRLVVCVGTVLLP